MIWTLVSNILLGVRALAWRSIYLGHRSRYDVDPAFRFNGTGIQLYGHGTIRLGAGSYIGEHSSLQSSAGLLIVVGARCRLSHNVRIYTESADADADFLQEAVPVVKGSVVIGDGVWIGTNVFIGPGVVIGDNAVVGANAVVTRSVPAGEIWGGVPARLIRAKRYKEGSA